MLEHRPLEGFVFAVTRFNFTSSVGNLPTAPDHGQHRGVETRVQRVYSAHLIMQVRLCCRWAR